MTIPTNYSLGNLTNLRGSVTYFFLGLLFSFLRGYFFFLIVRRQYLYQLTVTRLSISSVGG